MADLSSTIQNILSQTDAQEIKEVWENDFQVFSFIKVIEGKKEEFVILFALENDQMVIMNLYWYHNQFYKDLGIDFYNIINKLNTNIILGSIQISEENSFNKLVFKSSYVGDCKNFQSNNSFLFFLKVSFDMVGMVKDQLG
jgi:hypothetical protein